MKYISKIGKISSLIFYIFLLYQLWHLCQYGGIKSHFFRVVICTAGFVVAVILCLVSKRYKLKENKESTEVMKDGKKISNTILSFILCTLLFGGLIIYSAIPYHGALSWKIDEWLHKKETILEHDNLFEDGVEGVLTDLEAELDLPEELYIANKFQVTFDENGVIQSIYAFIYGKEDNEEKKTYLIDYNADVSHSMTVWIDGNVNGQYEQDMQLFPMIAILTSSDAITPIRYIMEPEYISQKQLDEERQVQQAEAAQNAERWTVDQADGTMYFFLDEEIGWRLVVTDAVAGSRYYEMEKTEDSGITWEHININPFEGVIGVTEGLVFFDENFGFAGLTGASQSYSQMYVTRNGGVTFEKIQLPMDMIEELPELASESGFTIEDYDYLNMPEMSDSVLTIMITTDVTESEGIIFQSKDDGVTWEYGGITQ